MMKSSYQRADKGNATVVMERSDYEGWILGKPYNLGGWDPVGLSLS